MTHKLEDLDIDLNLADEVGRETFEAIIEAKYGTLTADRHEQLVKILDEEEKNNS